MRRRMMMAAARDSGFNISGDGAVYSARPENLFKDTAGTLAVTTDGDVVKRMNDISGNGYHLLDAPSVSDPIYRTDGMLNWLEFPAGNYGLFADTLRSAGNNSRLISVAYEPLRDVESNALAGWSGPNTGSTWYQLQFREQTVNGDPYFAGFSNDLTDGSLISLTKKTAMVKNNGNSYQLLRNGLVTASGTKTINVANQPFRMGYQDIIDVKNSGHMKVFGAVVTLYHPAQNEIDSIEDFLSSLI